MNISRFIFVMISAPAVVLGLVVVSGGGVAWPVVSARAMIDNKQWQRFIYSVIEANGEQAGLSYESILNTACTLAIHK